MRSTGGCAIAADDWAVVEMEFIPNCPVDEFELGTSRLRYTHQLFSARGIALQSPATSTGTTPT